MMLRRVLCVLFLALCCACVCATAQEEGQYDAAVVEAGEGQDQTTTTTTTQQLLLRRPPPPPMHPPRTRRPPPPPMHPPRTQPPPRHRLLATGAASAALCGFRCRCCCLSVPLWRPPVLRAEDGAGRVRRSRRDPPRGAPRIFEHPAAVWMYICHCLWLCVLGVSFAVCFAPGSSGCDHLLFWLPLRAGPVPPARAFSATAAR
ncbi:putative mucin TcSMUGS [Trypanosoma cruzi]|uniref:Putative mucin TcSMUGS n=1 Tax=Trypanosoma cruzi TaxID=5693 RepID=A0A2V2X4Q3_TRYCR|nr:putative mucin TcSMUGS [Trypanosoma cruzi]